MPAFKDLTGQRFGRLTVLCPIDKRDKRGNIVWRCICDCGKLTNVRGYNLQNGDSRSCGCLRKEIVSKANLKHGEAGTRFYTNWLNMKARCLNKESPDYKYYGARGVSVCEEWKDNYLAFKFWAILNGYQDNLTIDRINHKGNYEPSNCQWITNSENVRKSWEERRKRR